MIVNHLFQAMDLIVFVLNFFFVVLAYVLELRDFVVYLLSLDEALLFSHELGPRLFLLLPLSLVLSVKQFLLHLVLLFLDGGLGLADLLLINFFSFGHGRDLLVFFL